jgi:hypothetical protein
MRHMIAATIDVCSRRNNHAVSRRLRYCPGVSRCRRFPWALLSLLFTACAAPPAEPRALPAQEEAGSVHVAVLSVARWYDYVDALQPYFDLTADGALGQVLRIGQISSSDELSRSRVELALGVNGPTPATSAPSGAQRAEPGAAIGVSPPQRDAHTAYSNAAALYQEVQLLNRYVRDAAIPKGYAPYVLRLQVTLLPRRRDAPYDAYSTLSFFSVGQGEIPMPVSLRTDTPPQSAAGPRVLPLLVTDNLEVSAASRGREQIQQVALALSGGSGGAGGALGFDSTEAKLDRLAGLDLNSLLTVARVSENTLMVRLGAMQQGSTRFAMVPRTHNVTVVVMIPQGSKSGLQVLARTVFKDAATGEPLPQRSGARIDELLIDAGKPHGLTDVALLGKLADLAQRNSYQEFEVAAAGVSHPLELWVDLVGLLAGGQYSSVTVGLEERDEPSPEIPDLTQAVDIQDDGQTCWMVLRGGQNLRPEYLDASLFISGLGDEGRIEARRVVVVGGVGVLVELPSLSAQKLAITQEQKVILRLRDHGRDYDYRKTDYRRTKPAKPGTAGPGTN